MTLSSSKPQDVKYPNQPLVEVASEIRFYGEPVIEAKRHEFYEAIRNEYPLVFVPALKEGKHPSLQHYKFEREDRKAGVNLALNSFGYFQREYLGATEYIQELLRLFALANDLFSIRRFSRIGWRYINSIPFVREGALIPLARFFKGAPSLFAIDSGLYERINFNAATHFEDKSISVRLESGGGNESNEVLIFDIDVYRDDLKDIQLKQKDISVLMDQLHCIARNFFEGSITDPYRNYLKGETV
jgi:uncharacterized protein (TIGR04255 family)